MASETPAATGAEKAFPPLDSNFFEPQLIWFAVIFGLLYLLLSRVALPRIGEVLEERRDRINRDLDEAQRLKDETEKAIASYEEALADARAKGQAIGQKARDATDKEVAAEKTEKESGLAQKLADAEAQITKAKETAMGHVNEVASDTAETLIDELLGHSVPKKEIAKVVADVATARGN